MGSFGNGTQNNSAKSDMLEKLKGRTPEQQKVIKYFYDFGGCGCLRTKVMSDAQYDEMVQKVAKGTDWKQKAMNKIGVDEEQLKEIEPIHFEGYDFDEKEISVKYGKDNVWRSSAYQISWLFFSSEQVYLYQYTFNMDGNAKKEHTEEYFYKDITNFSTTSDTIEKDVPEKTGCLGSVEYVKKSVDYTRFALVVPGDKLYCSMSQSEDNEAAVQGMKAKLREKKNA
ncbi:hypothetical protein J6Z39_07540 [bacterium]|nr:hypothetical protein [bacterium]